MTEALDIHDLAALGALGLLTDDEHTQIERVAPGEVIAYREALVQIAESLDPVTPPPFVKANILNAVRSRTVRANEGHWFPVSEGVRMKKLSSDRWRNTVTVLMEMEPRSEFPPHDHKRSEDSFCIRGSCTIGPETFFPGDFHHVESGAHHDAMTSEEGCLLLLVMDYEDYRAA
jgi:anti-sigma factor ChrR (cupin superfamily)